jgi:hypothetical protein
MPDLRRTRKKIKTALWVLLGIDALAVFVLTSPLVGSTSSRRQQLNQLWSDLRLKTRQVEPLKDLPRKVVLANQQINEFYKKRLAAQDSQIPTEFGKLAVENSVVIVNVKYKVQPAEVGRLQPVEMEAALSGNYVSLAKFINALERDDTLFIIDSVALGGEQIGPIRLEMKLEAYLKAGAQ